MNARGGASTGVTVGALVMGLLIGLGAMYAAAPSLTGGRQATTTETSTTTAGGGGQTVTSVSSPHGSSITYIP